MLETHKKLPLGVFTLSLFTLALIISFWPKDSCEKLESELGSGFFMRWQSPELLIVRAKQQSSFNADSKASACEQALSYFVNRSGDER